MNSFLKFALLPTELRLQIWRQAVDEPHRIVTLDAIFDIAVGGNSENVQQMILGGRFYRPWLSEAERATAGHDVLKAMSLTCRESRCLVTRMFPHFILLETPRISKVSNEQDTSNIPKRGSLRCNFETDIFFFRNISCQGLYYPGGIALYSMLHDLALHPDPAADEFRSVIKRIKKLGLEEPSENWYESLGQPNELLLGPSLATYACLVAAAHGHHALHFIPRRTSPIETTTQERWEWLNLCEAVASAAPFRYMDLVNNAIKLYQTSNRPRRFENVFVVAQGDS